MEKVMCKVTVFLVCNTPLGISEVVSLFQNPREDELQNLLPVRPRTGKIYLFRSEQRFTEW